MALESATYIDDLVDTNPTATDDVSQGDDHIRLLKSTIQASFPNITGAMTVSHTYLNNIEAGQVAFPATQNASADANTLDDYEEGVFVATLTPGTSGTITLGTATGDRLAYTKIGRQVHVQGLLTVSGVSSPSGVVRLGGLPFSAANLDATAGAVGFSIHAYNLATGGDRFLLGTLAESGNTVSILEADGTTIDSDFQATTGVYVSFTYFTT